MNKVKRNITGFLGLSMFMFGVLKFVDPFKTWYATQVEKSELPFQFLSYWSGQLGEIVIGALFLMIYFKHKNYEIKSVNLALILGNISIIIMMLVAIYVHLQPQVPADVLPLKIREPFIPGVFIVLSLINLYVQKNKS